MTERPGDAVAGVSGAFCVRRYQTSLPTIRDALRSFREMEDMMAEDYEREKLANAVGAFASAAPIQTRLAYAFNAMHTMKNHGFENADRQSEYEEIYNRLTEHGTYEQTCARLTDSEAEKIASQIIDLNTALNWSRVYELQDEIQELKRGDQ